MAALKPWIDFESAPESVSSDARSRPAQLAPLQARSDDTSSPQELRKGMTESEVKRLLGEPVKREPYGDGDLHVEILTFKRNDAMVEATMVEGVLVRFKEWSE